MIPMQKTLWRFSMYGIYQEQSRIFHGFPVDYECSRQKERWEDWVPDVTKCAAQFGLLLVMVVMVVASCWDLDLNRKLVIENSLT